MDGGLWMKLSVYAAPDFVLDKELKDKIVVVIDVLRATSTIITALYNDCKEVIPVIEIEEVIRMSKNYEKDTFLLCGERNAQAIDGFHLSNSPLEYTREQVAGKTILITTTNGTRAVRKASDAQEVLICSLVNVDATAEYLSGKAGDIVFICAGTNGKFSLDDIVTAGAVINKLKVRLASVELDDQAVVADAMYDMSKDDLNGLLRKGLHYKRMMSLGLVQDIAYCLTPNAAPVIGVYRDGVIKRLDKMAGGTRL
jgi:2-phosphosulfolactate phosphatase